MMISSQCPLLLLLSCSLLGSLAAFVAPRPAGNIMHKIALSMAQLEKDGRQILICGGGIGGLSSAFDARHLLRPQDKITVVSDREQFQFTPSNPWVALRKRTARDISLSLTDILPRHKIEFVHAKARTLNPIENKLVLEDGTKITYDFLIVATGPRLAFDEIPGAREGNTTASICTTPHAAQAAEMYDRLVKNPGPIVVGATQGASCFGPAYEYAMLLQYELGKRGGKKLVEQCPIHFITPEPYIGHLGLRGAGDSEKILTDMLNQRRIKYKTNCQVQRVNSGSVSIQYYDKNDNKVNEVLQSKLTMLVPPFRGHKVWTTVPGLTDEKGMLLVDSHQQSFVYPNIFGVGVCVAMTPLEETKVLTGVPKTGYMIESMGSAAVKNIRDIIRFESKKNKGSDAAPALHQKALLHGLCITDFGGDGAVFLAMPQMPPRTADYTITGKVATLAKVAFEKYFLHKVETGDTDPYYEKYMLRLVGVERTARD